MLLRVAEQAAELAELHLALLWRGDNVARLTDNTLFSSALELNVPPRLRLTTSSRYLAGLRTLRGLLHVHRHCVSFSFPAAVRTALAAPASARLAWMCQLALHESPHQIDRFKLRGALSALEKRRTRVVCPSESIQEQLMRLGYDRSLLTLIRNGVDTAHFSATPPHEEAGHELRAKLGIPADALVLCCVARLDPGKGHRTLFAALAELRTPDIHLVCVGDSYPGTRSERLWAEASYQTIASQVHWVGQQADVRPWLTMSDAVVLPSLHEAGALSLLEGGAMERPMLGSRAGAIAEIIVDGVNGFLFEPQAPGDCARAIERLRSSNCDRRGLGLAARARVVDHFSDTVMRQQWSSFFRSFLTDDMRV